VGGSRDRFQCERLPAHASRDRHVVAGTDTSDAEVVMASGRGHVRAAPIQIEGVLVDERVDRATHIDLTVSPSILKNAVHKYGSPSPEPSPST
jgi:hypothetical protein